MSKTETNVIYPPLVLLGFIDVEDAKAVRDVTPIPSFRRKPMDSPWTYVAT
jgi:hypothetical protein